MRNPWATEKTLGVLLLICLAQALWIVLHLSPSATLSRVAATYPVGEQGMLYVVISDAGGATVPFTYRYYVYRRMDDEQQALNALRKEGEAFLVTRDADAQVHVQGTEIRIAVKDTVYSFRNATLFHHSGGYTPVNVWLNAQPATQ